MGDRRKRALRVQFDGKLRLEFHGAKITSDAGLLPFRELDEAFRLTEKGSTVLSDPRHGKNTRHTILAMLRQGVYGRLAGYEDVNDAERLRVEMPQNRGSEGGGGWIVVSACREGGPLGKRNGKTGGFRLDQVARLGTIAARGLEMGNPSL